MELNELEQRPGEPIIAFLTHFNTAVVGVGNYEPHLALMSLKGAINKKTKLGQWIKKKKKPSTLEELFDKAEEYIGVDEDPAYAMDVPETST